MQFVLIMGFLLLLPNIVLSLYLLTSDTRLTPFGVRYVSGVAGAVAIVGLLIVMGAAGAIEGGW